MIADMQHLRRLYAEALGERLEHDGIRFGIADGLGVETQLEVIADPDAVNAGVPIRKRREPKPTAEARERRPYV